MSNKLDIAKHEKRILDGTLLPDYEKVIARVVKKSNTTNSGIILPESKDQNQEIIYGSVISVGRGRITHNGSFIPSEVSKGYIIFFESWKAKKIIETDGYIYWSVPQSEIHLYGEDKEGICHKN